MTNSPVIRSNHCFHWTQDLIQKFVVHHQSSWRAEKLCVPLKPIFVPCLGTVYQERQKKQHNSSSYLRQLSPHRLCRCGQLSRAPKETWRVNLIYRSIKHPSIQVSSLMLLRFFWAQNLALFLSLPAQYCRIWDCYRATLSQLNAQLSCHFPAWVQTDVPGTEVSPTPMLEWERKSSPDQSISDSNCIEMLST